MIDRYQAPRALQYFSAERKLSHWRFITDQYAYAAGAPNGCFSTYPTPTPDQVVLQEKSTGHDVVAFLELYTQAMPGSIAKYVHHGLTSSDLTEYSTHVSIRRHADGVIDLLGSLDAFLFPSELGQGTRIGRTHGQLAEVTNARHQLLMYQHQIRRIQGDLIRFVGIGLLKTPGPTGCSPVSTPRMEEVARLTNATPIPSTQVLPRDYLLTWSCLYLRVVCLLESLATWVRLGSRAEVGELAEGAERIGSSSMPHKRNPIQSEKVCGLARAARGYVLAISESCALWEDRDLSNSSTERIVVPDLAAVVEHMLLCMVDVMKSLVVHRDVMVGNALREEGFTSIMQAVTQELLEIGPIQTAELVREALSVPHPLKENRLHSIARMIGVPENRVSEWVDKVQSYRQQQQGEEQ